MEGNKNSMADSREVMNIRQASQYLGVSPDTLYKYVNEQTIPAFWRSGCQDLRRDRNVYVTLRLKRTCGDEETSNTEISRLPAAKF